MALRVNEPITERPSPGDVILKAHRFGEDFEVDGVMRLYARHGWSSVYTWEHYNIEDIDYAARRLLLGHDVVVRFEDSGKVRAHERVLLRKMRPWWEKFYDWIVRG